jgi:hypothetical protein
MEDNSLSICRCSGASRSGNFIWVICNHEWSAIFVNGPLKDVAVVCDCVPSRASVTNTVAVGVIFYVVSSILVCESAWVDGTAGC